ncbi:MAG: hypothetical protein J6Z80_05040 [Clostridia bacterium]|nr:hypothetical protein [Clostridia bacterium]
MRRNNGTAKAVCLVLSLLLSAGETAPVLVSVYGKKRRCSDAGNTSAA